jgi:hypothetical protein
MINPPTYPMALMPINPISAMELLDLSGYFGGIVKKTGGLLC